MNVVFLMDPLETVHPTKDTTLMLMAGAHRRGHTVFCLFDGGLSLRDGQVALQATQVTPVPEQRPPFQVGQSTLLTHDQVGAVFIRTDPPFDERYLMNTWLLDRLPASVPVINAPAGIRTVNEKLWATQFPSLTPPTLVSQDLEACRAFVHEEGDVIIKPTNGYGGRSVFHVTKADPNLNVILETSTQGGTNEVIVQRYVAEATYGDKRILLLEGEPLGAILRVHEAGDHRNNLMAGGRPESTTITKDDRRIIDVLKPHLKRLGLYLVGIDVIGQSLIEVNVTSPTCLQEMNRISGQQLEERVIDLMEKLTKRTVSQSPAS